MKIPELYNNLKNVSYFIENNVGCYIAAVNLTSDRTKAKYILQPIKVEKMVYEVGACPRLLFINGKKKISDSSVFDYFHTKQEANLWFDEKLENTKNEIKNKINNLIDKYNELDNYGINANRSKKLTRILK